MRKINIVLLILVLFSLASCNTEDETITKEVEKQDFYVQTSKITELPKDYVLEKSWIIESSQNIALSSNAVWRVSRVDVQEWQKVVVWQILAYLEDNIWSYNINLQRTWNALEMAKINYESTKISLDKQVFDLEVNLENLNDSLNSLEEEKIESLRQNQSNLDNSDVLDENSKSYLDLEKLKNTIEKMELDYNSQLTANNQNIEGYRLSLKKEQNTLSTMMNDIIDFSDQLLWITDNYEDESDKIKDYLWWKDKVQKQLSYDSLRNLITYKENEFSSLSLNNLEIDNIILNLSIIDNWYDKIKLVLTNLEETLNNSIESYWVLWSIEITGFIGQINWYQASFAWNYAWFVGYNNWTSTFLRTYKNSEDSTKKQIDLLKKDKEILEKSLSLWNLWADVSYNKTIISYDDRLKGIKSQLKIAENNLENAKKTREITLRSLNNSISSAQISNNESFKQLSKLIIKSPINWVINWVFIDKWQEVNQWTKVFSVFNNKIPEVKIYFDQKELWIISVWKTIYWKRDSKTFTWSIVSISSIADSNLKYSATVTFNDWFDLIGELIDIEIPIETEKLFLPINVVEIVENNVWFAKVLENSQVKNVEFKFWEIQNDKIEVMWCTELWEEDCISLDIILNDTTNFDKEKFNIVVK